MTYYPYPHQVHAECARLLGNRERRCSGRYMYFKLTDPSDKTSDIMFFWGRDSPNTYAWLTKDDVLTIDHKYTNCVWLQNHIHRIFDIRIHSDASNHRNHKYKVRLWRAHPHYQDLPFINGTQFRRGQLHTPLGELLSQDLVRRIDRKKAKEARNTVAEVKNVLFAAMRLGVKHVLQLDDTLYHHDELYNMLCNDLPVETKLNALVYLYQGNLSQWHIGRWDPDELNRRARLGWKKFDDMLLEKHGAYVYQLAN